MLILYRKPQIKNNQVSTVKRLPKLTSSSFAFTFLLGMYAALPALSIDISTPTLPLLQRALATSSVVAGLTLSSFMGGFAFGQLTGGVSSDRGGRRPVLLAGLACYSVAGVACALSQSGFVLVFARLVQGVGAGACSVLAFAIVQDLFEGNAARVKRSYVTVVFGVVPILAPALGSLLSNVAGWRSIHYLLASLGGALFAVTWYSFSESLRAEPKAPKSQTTRDIARLWNDREFVTLTLANALSYAVIFAYIAGSPIVVLEEMGQSASVFAGLFACTAAALTAGAWINGELSRRGVGIIRLLRVSLGATVASTFALALACVAGTTSAAVLVPLLMVILAMRGFIAPNLQHLAMARHAEQAGTASATIGTTQLLSGALVSAAVAFLLPHWGISAVAIPMALLASAALILPYRARG